jgi:hypothetical protein
MYRIAIEELGGLQAGTARVEFELEPRSGLPVREFLHQVVAKEIETRGLKLSLEKIAAYQREATRAFTTGVFTMLMDGTPVTDLDALLPVDKDCEVIFIRLVPMVGG